MATSSWTPGSTIHLNDGTAEQDLSFINNDSFGSVYRYYGPAPSLTVSNVIIRHNEEAATLVKPKGHRHNMVYTHLVPGTSGALDSLYSASLNFQTPAAADPAFMSQIINGLAALLSVSAVRSQLVSWRI
jgi:hypothetical protein